MPRHTWIRPVIHLALLSGGGGVAQAAPSIGDCSAMDLDYIPDTHDSATCDSVCTSAAGYTITCSLAASPSEGGILRAHTTTVASDWDYLIWGEDDGTDFCCAVLEGTDGEIADFVFNGSDWDNSGGTCEGDTIDLWPDTDTGGPVAQLPLAPNSSNDSVDAVVNAGDGCDVILGSNHGGDSTYHEVLNGEADGDTIDGNQGDDDLDGGGGADVLSGYLGADTIYGGGGDDTIYGTTSISNGNETSETDVLFGEIGDDSIVAGRSPDTVYGGVGNDTIYGGLEADYIDGGSGNDSIYGDEVVEDTRDGDDTIIGGTGTDVIRAGDGDDSVLGGADNDTLYGGSGSDTMAGGSGADTIYGEDGADSLCGCLGNDLIEGDDTDATTAYSDTINGGGGPDTIFGYIGDDVIQGSADADDLYGGDGDDLICDKYASGQGTTRDYLNAGGDDDTIWYEFGAGEEPPDGSSDAGSGTDTCNDIGLDNCEVETLAGEPGACPYWDEN